MTNQRPPTPPSESIGRLLMLSLLLWGASVPSMANAEPAAAPPKAPATPTAKHDPDRPSEAAKRQALELYEQGSEAFAALQYADAVHLFLRADQQARSASFAYNIATAYEQLGDSSHALEWWRRYLRREPEAAERAHVERRIKWFEQKLRARGVQQITVRSTPEGATVHIDQRPVGVTPWTGDLVAGPHQVDLQLAGHEPKQQTFELDGARALDLSLTLVASAPSAAPRAPIPSAAGIAPTDTAPAEPPDDDGNVGALTWVSLGVGVASLGVAIGLELARSSAEDNAREATIQIHAAEHADTMDDYQLAGRVMLGVGIGATLVGAVLLALDLDAGGAEPEDESEAATSRFDAACGPGGCLVGVNGSF